MTTEHVSVPRDELEEIARELSKYEAREVAYYARHFGEELQAILSRATPSDVKVPEKLQFNAGDSPFIVQRKEGWNDCIEKMIGSDSQRFALDQSFVDRVTQGDDESPDVIGAGCADSIKRVAEEMVHACKAVLQGDAEFTHDAVDDWAHRIMCFADYVPRKPSAPRVVTDWIVASALHAVLGDSYDHLSGECLVDAKHSMRQVLESFATSLPAAIPPGYVVVPVEPTVDMQTAGAIAHSQAEESCRIELAQEDDIVFSQCPSDSMRWRKNRAAYVYKSMLAAAPQAGEME